MKLKDSTFWCLLFHIKTVIAIGLFHKQPLDDIPPFKAILVCIVVSFAVLPCCVQKVWELPSIKRAHYTIRHANFFRHFSDCKQIMVKIAPNCKTSQSQGIHLQKWDKVMAVWKIFMSPHILIIEFDLSQWQIAFSHCFQRLKYVRHWNLLRYLTFGWSSWRQMTLHPLKMPGTTG